VWGNPIFRASVLGCHVANEVRLRDGLENNSAHPLQKGKMEVLYGILMACFENSRNSELKDLVLMVCRNEQAMALQYEVCSV